MIDAIKLRNDNRLDILKEILGCEITYKQDNVYSLSSPMDQADYQRLINGFDFSEDKESFLKEIKSEILNEKIKQLETVRDEYKHKVVGNPKKIYDTKRYVEKLHEWHAAITIESDQETFDYFNECRINISTHRKIEKKFKEVKRELNSLKLPDLTRFDPAIQFRELNG